MIYLPPTLEHPLSPIYPIALIILLLIPFIIEDVGFWRAARCEHADPGRCIRFGCGRYHFEHPHPDCKGWVR